MPNTNLFAAPCALYEMHNLRRAHMQKETPVKELSLCELGQSRATVALWSEFQVVLCPPICMYILENTVIDKLQSTVSIPNPLTSTWLFVWLFVGILFTHFLQIHKEVKQIRASVY